MRTLTQGNLINSLDQTYEQTHWDQTKKQHTGETIINCMTVASTQTHTSHQHAHLDQRQIDWDFDWSHWGAQAFAHVLMCTQTHTHTCISSPKLAFYTSVHLLLVIPYLFNLDGNSPLNPRSNYTVRDRDGVFSETFRKKCQIQNKATLTVVILPSTTHWIVFWTWCTENLVPLWALDFLPSYQFWQHSFIVLFFDNRSCFMTVDCKQYICSFSIITLVYTRCWNIAAITNPNSFL